MIFDDDFPAEPQPDEYAFSDLYDPNELDALSDYEDDLLPTSTHQFGGSSSSAGPMLAGASPGSSSSLAHYPTTPAHPVGAGNPLPPHLWHLSAGKLAEMYVDTAGIYGSDGASVRAWADAQDTQQEEEGKHAKWKQVGRGNTRSGSR